MRVPKPLLPQSVTPAFPNSALFLGVDHQVLTHDLGWLTFSRKEEHLVEHFLEGAFITLTTLANITAQEETLWKRYFTDRAIAYSEGFCWDHKIRSYQPPEDVYEEEWAQMLEGPDDFGAIALENLGLLQGGPTMMEQHEQTGSIAIENIGFLEGGATMMEEDEQTGLYSQDDLSESTLHTSYTSETVCPWIQPLETTIYYEDNDTEMASLDEYSRKRTYLQAVTTITNPPPHEASGTSATARDAYLSSSGTEL